MNMYTLHGQTDGQIHTYVHAYLSACTVHTHRQTNTQIHTYV